MPRIPFHHQIDMTSDPPDHLFWQQMFLEMSPEEREMTIQNLRRQINIKSAQMNTIPKQPHFH